ncbi:MAG: hypothetical protein ACFFCM_08725 [Promethearchaeota archaeon]
MIIKCDSCSAPFRDFKLDQKIVKCDYCDHINYIVLEENKEQLTDEEDKYWKIYQEILKLKEIYHNIEFIDDDITKLKITIGVSWRSLLLNIYLDKFPKVFFDYSDNLKSILGDPKEYYLTNLDSKESLVEKISNIIEIFKLKLNFNIIDDLEIQNLSKHFQFEKIKDDTYKVYFYAGKTAECIVDCSRIPFGLNFSIGIQDKISFYLDDFKLKKISLLELFEQIEYRLSISKDTENEFSIIEQNFKLIKLEIGKKMRKVIVALPYSNNYIKFIIFLKSDYPKSCPEFTMVGAKGKILSKINEILNFYKKNWNENKKIISVLSDIEGMLILN